MPPEDESTFGMPVNAEARSSRSLLRKAILRIFFVTWAVTAVSAHCEDWPAFRGPHNNGHTEDSAPTDWSNNTNIAWRVPLPRPANGSPVVAGGRVLVTSSEDEAGNERSLYCFDRKTGEILWVESVHFDRQMPTHKTNPYAGTTPAIDDGKVVVWHGSAGLHCYDLEGRKLWTRDFGEFEHIWGYGTSPLIHQGRVVFNTGPGKSVSCICVDLASGDTIWKTEEPLDGDGSRNAAGKYMGSWSTPVVVTVNNRPQVLVAMPTRLNAYDLETGKVVWHCRGVSHAKGDLAYSSPTLVEELCFYTGGFGGPMFAAKIGGEGDVTESNLLWRQERQPQSIGSPVAVDGYIYRPNADPGTLQCLDPENGQTMWEARAAGGKYWGSVVFAGGLLYATDQQGTTIVFKPNPEEYEEVSRNELNDPTNATPAISEGEIFIRTAKYLWCIK